MDEKAERGEGVAFVVYDGLTILDLVGPLQVLTRLGTTDPRYRAVVVGERTGAYPTDTPLEVVPDKTFDDVPTPFGVIVPGGGTPTLRAMGDERLLAYLKSAASSAEFVGSVCTGALILGSAGFLEGRKATTHWAYHRLLERLGAAYVPKRWVEDGKFITAAGVSAGIDMALHLAGRLVGEDVARLIQLGIEYDPQPPFGAIDWSAVDRDSRTAELEDRVRTALAHKPELVRRLTA